MIEDSIIIKGVGSFYEVLDHGKQITCKAKGSFRRDGITPLVGDRVRYEVHEKGYAQIIDILPRKTSFYALPPPMWIDCLLSFRLECPHLTFFCVTNCWWKLGWQV